VRALPWMRRQLSDMQGLVLLGGVLAAGFLSASFPIGVFGVVSLLLIRLSGGIMSPWVSVVVNREVPSQVRATTLSTVALLTKIPYAATAILAGAMADTMTAAEYKKLHDRDIYGQYRLSCQILCNHDMEVEPQMTLENQEWTDTGPEPDEQVQPVAEWFPIAELERTDGQHS
jgi:hypothetical protein